MNCEHNDRLVVLFNKVIILFINWAHFSYFKSVRLVCNCGTSWLYSLVFDLAEKWVMVKFSKLYHTMQGDIKSSGIIKIQRPFQENGCDVNKSKEINFIYFCFTVECIERDIGGKLFGIIDITTLIYGSLETMLLGSWQSIKALKSHSFDSRLRLSKQYFLIRYYLSFVAE